MFQIKVEKNAKKLEFHDLNHDFLLRKPAFYEECGQKSHEEDD